MGEKFSSWSNTLVWFTKSELDLFLFDRHSKVGILSKVDSLATFSSEMFAP